MINTLKGWFKKYKKFFFRYRSGFYELPYFANSPYAINAGYMDAPFIKHDKVNNRFVANNPFLKAQTTFYKIEEGFWIYFTVVEYKRNIKFIPYYDKDIKDSYYMFSFNEMRDNFKLKIRSERKEWHVDKSFWTLYKPLSNPDYFGIKKSQMRSITIFFNHEWLSKNIVSNPEWKNTKALEFLNSEKKLVSWPEVQGISLEKNFQHDAMLNQDKKDFKQAEQYSKNLTRIFFTALSNADNCNYFELSDVDRNKVFAIEKYLISKLTDDFEGIDSLAKQFGISPTKLKSDFKTQYGTSIFQFFREKQMQLAEQLIQSKQYTIKEVAQHLGYENASKFSAAFKECRGVLPSDV